eukprot:scaffold3944_cov361-Prasinococcus_capsulatus_cf.AAC.4
MEFGRLYEHASASSYAVEPKWEGMRLTSAQALNAAGRSTVPLPPGWAPWRALTVVFATALACG